ncbi:hydrolase [Microbacterium phage Shocker]|uniref:Hydrolase n=1 Tax=Microbacterium phage Shocker TaxID=2805839 RepID=A0A890UNA5_9CAUD|nr:hydrolase [Microbacterium phage Shocker]QRI45083.1 hydrolase [Microbacterium phage Shocker]
MTIYENSFEGGTAGTAVSAANSASGGTAFNSVATGVVFDSSRAHTGSMAAGFTTAASSGYVAWYPTSPTSFAARAYFWLDTANNTGEFNLIGVFEANGNSVLIFRIAASNILRAYKNIAPTANVWAPTTAMPTGKWVRAELLFEQGTTTANGRCRVAIFDNNSLTAIADSGWVTGLNFGFGTNSPAHVRFGKGAPNSPVAGVVMDDLVVRSGADYTGNFIGPSVVPITAPAYRWDGTKYVPLAAYRWNGTTYVAVDSLVP